MRRYLLHPLTPKGQKIYLELFCCKWKGRKSKNERILASINCFGGEVSKRERGWGESCKNRPERKKKQQTKRKKTQKQLTADDGQKKRTGGGMIKISPVGGGREGCFSPRCRLLPLRVTQPAFLRAWCVLFLTVWWLREWLKRTCQGVGRILRCACMILNMTFRSRFTAELKWIYFFFYGVYFMKLNTVASCNCLLGFFFFYLWTLWL